jgi:hypothetical protein
LYLFCANWPGDVTVDGFLDDTYEYCRVIDEDAGGGREMLTRWTLPVVVFGSDERPFLLFGDEEDDNACGLRRASLLGEAVWVSMRVIKQIDRLSVDNSQ